MEWGRYDGAEMRYNGVPHTLLRDVTQKRRHRVLVFDEADLRKKEKQERRGKRERVRFSLSSTGRRFAPVARRSRLEADARKRRGPAHTQRLGSSSGFSSRRESRRLATPRCARFFFLLLFLPDARGAAAVQKTLRSSDSGRDPAEEENEKRRHNSRPVVAPARLGERPRKLFC